MLTSAECIAKAADLERKAEESEAGRASYLRMATAWRGLGRQAAFFEEQGFEPRVETRGSK
jgi:hypothetical protein